MKHKHYDMIVAKAENVNLVVFVRDGKCWMELVNETPFYSVNDYFLCDPKHADTVLRSLNGEIAESTNKERDGWSESSIDLWDKNYWYMLKNYDSRIKPKKEKRWIVVNPIGNSVNVNLMKIAPDISEYPKGCQSVEIEVEV